MAETDLAKRIDGLIKPCISVITKDSERYRNEWGSYLTFDFKPLKGDCVELVLGGARVKARAGVYHALGVEFGAAEEEAGSDFDQPEFFNPDKPEEYASWRIWGMDDDPTNLVLMLDDTALIKAAGKTSVSWWSSLFDDGFQMPMVATNPDNPLDLSETAFITLQTLIEGLQKQALEVAKGKYPTQDTQPIDNYFQGLSKVSNPKYLTDFTVGKPKEIKVSGANEEPIETMIVVSGDDDSESIAKLFPGTTINTNNAAVSMWRAGREFVTSADIARVALSIDKPTQNQISKIDKDMEWLERVAEIDYTAEARGRELLFEGEPVESLIIRGQLVPHITKGIKTVNGRISNGYQLLAPPLLYRHDEALGQITSVPIKMFEDAASSVSSTDMNIQIRTYLVSRIARMKNDKSANSEPKIRYDTIMGEIGKGNDPRGKNKKAVREAVKAYLDVFARWEYIKSYTEYEEEKRKRIVVAGVYIEVR